MYIYISICMNYRGCENDSLGLPHPHFGLYSLIRLVLLLLSEQIIPDAII